MFLEVPDLLTADEVAKLNAIAGKAPFVDGRISNPHAQFKNNVQIDTNSAEHRESSQLVHAAIVRNENVVNFTFPKMIAAPMLTRHGPGMAYGAHADTAFMAMNGAPFRSDVSCTIFLSRPETYEGGELCVHVGNRPVFFKLPAGGAIFYPSTTLHEVRPVKSGLRLVAISFMESRVANAAHREMLYELNEVDALEGLRMKWQNRVRLGVVIQALLREWS